MRSERISHHRIVRIDCAFISGILITQMHVFFQRLVALKSGLCIESSYCQCERC
ncbi:unnamed protein product [Rhodiola kirilowii]